MWLVWPSPFFWLLNTDRPVFFIWLALILTVGIVQPTCARLPGPALTMVRLSPTHSTWGLSLIFIVSAILIAGAALGDQCRTISISNHTSAAASAPAAR